GSQFNVRVADDVLEGRRTPGAVVVEGLVDDIPGINRAVGPVVHHPVNVVVHDVGQVGRARNTANPTGELAVPDERVPVDFHGVGLGKGHMLVGLGKGED